MSFSGASSAYVHVPFCRHRCGYCNFTLVAGRDHWIERYLQAIETELSGLQTPRPQETLFLGGGTPTHLNCEQLGRLLDIVSQWLPLAEGGEWSIESNPRDLESDEKLQLLSRAGVTRLSLGAQSFRREKLELLERDHCGELIRDVVRTARSGFQSISIDLIFGVPGETLEEWTADVEQALALQIDHLSTYGLTFEKGTRFWNRLQHGELSNADDELEALMYQQTLKRTRTAGWDHYEVSSFAVPGHRCRHNQVYWSGDPYFGFGPGAASYLDGVRRTNHRSTGRYLQWIESGRSPVAEEDVLTAEDRAREMLVIGLRRLEGWDEIDFAERMGVTIDQLAGETIAEMIRHGWLERSSGRLRLTQDGLLLSDSLWPALLAD